MDTYTLSDFDTTLIAEIEELFRHRLSAGERDGMSAEELHRLAEHFDRMYELLDNGLHKRITPWADRAFRDETYHVVADGFMDKLHALYDDKVTLSSAQTSRMIEQTRHKLHRVRLLLEC